MAATERQKLAFRDKFRSLHHEDFQSWFEELARALHPPGHFQSIRKTSGDGGLDGLVINSQLVYQVYAPARIRELQDSKTAAKIRDDFQKAYSTLNGHIKAWHFVHNHPQAELGPRSMAALSDLEHQHPGIEFQPLDIKSLEKLISGLPEEVIDKLVGTRTWRPTQRALLTVLALSVLSIALLEAFWRPRETWQSAVTFLIESPQPAAEPLFRPSVAVLTFENQSDSPDLDWLSTALSEVVSAKLGLGNEIRAVNRHEVAFTERDLVLPPKKKISAEDLLRLRKFLGVRFIAAGAYKPVGDSSTLQLELVLYDAENGRVLTESREVGETEAWFDLADRASGGPSPLPSFRRALGVESLTLDQRRSLRALFPISLQAARLYAEGLERYRQFDTPGAFEAFGGAVEHEPHPLVLAALADVGNSLGLPNEATEAIREAVALEQQTRGKPNALPERYRREIRIVERKVTSDEEGAAQEAVGLFRDFFYDDLSAGLLAAEALQRTGRPQDALALLDELKRLPFSGQAPQLEYAQAESLFMQQRYDLARAAFERSIQKAVSTKALFQEAIARFLFAAMLIQNGEIAKGQTQSLRARDCLNQVADDQTSAHFLDLEAFRYTSINLNIAGVMYREAIKSYENLGALEEASQASSNLRGILLRQGCHSEGGAPPLDEEFEEFLKGWRFYCEGRLADARDFFDAAKITFDAEDQKSYHASILTNLGEIEYMMGQLENAKDFHQTALTIHNDLHRPAEAAYDAVNLARVEIAQGNYTGARERLVKLGLAQPVVKNESHALETRLESHLLLAELELLTDQPSKAEEWSESAAHLAGGAGLDTFRSRALHLKVRALLDQGRRKESAQTLEMALKIPSKDFRVIREGRISQALVLAASGQTDRAIRILVANASECAQSGQVMYQLESQFAAGEIAHRHGLKGDLPLNAVRDRAAGLGFHSMVDRVTKALGE